MALTDLDHRGSRGPRNAVTDVDGVRVGHARLDGELALTGTTVVLPPPGTVGAVDVMGGGPGTRDTDALDPRNLAPAVDAVVLTGGSAYGLAAADGAMAWLEERGRGVPISDRAVVPIVPAAVVFDLGRGGDTAARPGPAQGRAAIAAAHDSGDNAPVAQGVVGAGTGTTAGGLKGGVGTASTLLPDGTVVGALVVLNSAGSPVDPVTGLPYGLVAALPAASPEHLAGLLDDPEPPEFPLRLPSPAVRRAALTGDRPQAPETLNTTLGVLAINATLTKPQAQKLAGAGNLGIARAVRPSHTLVDGETVFALATGRSGPPADVPALNRLLAAAADTVSRAIVHALLAADTVTTPWRRIPSYRELYLP
ncbi:hypothetical protein BIV57_10650 [Mangrovactinospora gilvigrisea]|uniref:Hydrolase n=1 Tax=Mangrovactinospora gilvigrisea TaxID=1428644 RepID=A0A1J7BFZ1_9ACTN|nr:P1 family peptidase [Mangrovactinospora gilvigrisea]OIV37493.1 hypothetical protein BIV57_10650 [Mangrovactinospora gilvigrisea]